MGVDFNAILFYGFEAEDDKDNSNYDIDRDLYEFMEEIYMKQGETIQLQKLQRGWDNTIYIVANDSWHSASNGGVHEVAFNFYDMIESVMQFKDFCERYAFKYAEPKWYIASTID